MSDRRRISGGVCNEKGQLPLPFARLRRTQPRQEPGRYFARMVVPVPPQTQRLIGRPTSVEVNGLVASLNGMRVNVLVVAVSCVRLPSSATTVIAPLSSTATDLTYFDGEVPEVESQPNSAADNAEALVVWTVSVTVVRQDEAASTTSETLARTV